MATSYSISALGTCVFLQAKDSTGNVEDANWIKDFPSDGNPISIEDANVGSLEIDVNGESYRKAALKPVTVALMLIPWSDEDKWLNEICLKNIGIKHHRFYMSIRYYNQDLTPGTYSHEDVDLDNGILKGVQKGYTFVGDGRVDYRKYTFEFPPPGNYAIQ